MPIDELDSGFPVTPTVQISTPNDATSEEFASISADNFALRMKTKLREIFTDADRKLKNIQNGLESVSQNNRLLLLGEKIHKLKNMTPTLSTQTIGESLSRIGEEMQEFEGLGTLPNNYREDFIDLIMEFKNCPIGIMYSTTGIFVVDREFKTYPLAGVNYGFVEKTCQ